MYTIMGATGKVGGRIAEELLAKGKEVRCVGRSAERLQPLVDKGAEAAVGEVTDGRERSCIRKEGWEWGFLLCTRCDTM